MITIDIVSDTVCPWCFIGKRRLERALAQRSPGEEFRVSWRPFQLNPDMPPEGRDRKAHLIAKFGGEDGLKRVYDAVIEAGKSEGIDFAFDKVERTPNTINSHRLLRMADEKGTQDAVSEELFKAYFLDGKDIGVIDVLVEIAETAGMKGGCYQRPPYPSTWARRHGKGRVFFTAMGHRENVWVENPFQQIVLGGLAWALGNVEVDVMPNVDKVTPQANRLKT